MLPLSAVTLPPQVVAAPPATVMPEGKWSVRGAVSVSTTELLLFNVKVSSEMPLSGMLAGLKDLPKVGATRTGVISGETVSVATTGAVLLPLLVFNEPEGRELM